MLSQMKRMITVSNPSFRLIQSSCVRLKEEIKYEKGKLIPVEKPDKPHPVLIGTLIQYHKWDFSLKGMKSSTSKLKAKLDRKDQIYNKNRVKTLGSNLAAAHFFIVRGGIVKFEGIDVVFDKTTYNKLPNWKDPSYRVEAISLPNFNLFYEGLDHFVDLNNLKALSFHGVVNFDNWYLDRLSHLVPILEYLDISYCKKIDYNGLHCLYRFRNLKCLNVEGISDSLEFRLGCLTVESEKPDLVVIGLLTKPKAKSAFDLD